MSFEVVGMSAVNRSLWREALGIKERVTDVSSAELLALHTTQVQLIPAPGPDLFIDSFRYLAEYTHGGVSYTDNGGNAGDLVAIYGAFSYVGQSIPARRWVFWPGNLVKQTVSASSFGSVGTEIQFADGSWPNTEFVNQPLQLALLGHANMLLGNGTLKVKLRYEIRELG